MQAKESKAQVLIIGEMPCCVCGEAMTQKDVDNQQAILSTPQSKSPVINIIAHVHHFWDAEKNQHPADYELSMKKIALAVAKDRGGLNPETERRAIAEIEKMERKYQR